MPKGFVNKNTAKEAGAKSTRKGVRNKRTLEWEQLGEFITEAGAKRVMDYLGNIEDDKEFFDRYERLLSYFKPKQASTNVKQEGDITIKIIDADGT